jgi:cyclopropane fatty-acyl-phospholipid synthase-like methyltransferase
MTVEPKLADCRHFDVSKVARVVSMGMFEHVGSKKHRTSFKRARSFLKDDGLLLLHTIAEIASALIAGNGKVALQLTAVHSDEIFDADDVQRFTD